MKKFGVWFFGLTFIAIGIVHFASPDTFVGIIPTDWPAREWLNILAGMAEVSLGFLFLLHRTRVLAGYGLCLMLIAFWALHGVHLFYPPSDKLPFWGYLVRFLFQPVLIYLVWKLKDLNQKSV
jgi:uncharacterized membrane protein